MKNNNPWVDYWNAGHPMPETIWQKYSDVFIRDTMTILNYQASDVVLDIGCGLGCLIDFLKDKVAAVYGVDVSSYYISLGKKKCSGNKNVFFYELDHKNYTDFSFFTDKKFSIIICKSVIQYYQSKEEMKQLMKEVKRIALPGAKFLIADIPVSCSFFSDFWISMYAAWKGHYLKDYMNFLFHICKSNPKYRKLVLSRTLTYTADEFQRIMDEFQVRGEWLTNAVTPKRNRKNLLMYL